MTTKVVNKKEKTHKINTMNQLPKPPPSDKRTPRLALSPGNVAVITGASSGIGKAAAIDCAKRKMKLCICDIDKKMLQKTKIELQQIADDEDIMTVICDVRDKSAVEKVKEQVYKHFGQVNLLFNNAGIGGGGGPFENFDRWHEVINTNLFGYINFVHTFVPSMIEQNNPCVVVNTGSKQGITKPPGDTAYNISKAGVITLTEGLEHKFRSTEGCNITAFLLIPGWVNSMLSYKTNRRLNGDSFDEKTVRFHEEGKQHEGQWTPKQTTDLMFAAIENGAPFYIMCPDNDMTNDMMHAGVQWGSNDITMSRPPLSRWHDDYKEDYQKFREDYIKKQSKL